MKVVYMAFLVMWIVNEVVHMSSGCQLLVYPGAFNMTTGPAHWELLQRGRSGSDYLSQSKILLLKTCLLLKNIYYGKVGQLISLVRQQIIPN